MQKNELLVYIRQLKKVLDEHVENQLPIDNDVDKDMRNVCKKIVETKTILEPQFFNELYKFIVYLEDTKMQIHDTEKYLHEIDSKYTEERNSLSGLYREFFVSMALSNINRIICELEYAH